MASIFARLLVIPQTVADGMALINAVKAIEANASIQSLLANDPVLAGQIALVSREIRSLESDVSVLKG